VYSTPSYQSRENCARDLLPHCSEYSAICCFESAGAAGAWDSGGGGGTSLSRGTSQADNSPTTAMKKYLLVFVLCLIAGCASFDGTGPFSDAAGDTRTFAAPISRVKPAAVSTIAQMGMSISSIETRGGREILKARKSGSSIEVGFERLGPSSTRMRVVLNAGASYDAAGTSRFMQQIEKALAAS
jgi:hypothetical protein